MKKYKYKYKLISYEKMTQNSISPPLLSLKIMKSAPRNPLIENFLAIPRAHSSFPKKQINSILLKRI
jgi:hypothetical protein